MKTEQRFIMATLALCLLTLLSTSAKADPLTLTLTFPNQTGTVGNILTFGGSVTNVAAPAVQIVSSQVTFNDGGGTLLFDDSPFVANFLLQTVGAGATLGPLDMFTVEILAAATPGTYAGVFSVLYDNGTSHPGNKPLRVLSHGAARCGDPGTGDAFVVGPWADGCCRVRTQAQAKCGHDG